MLACSSGSGGGGFNHRSQELDRKRTEQAGTPVLLALVPAFLAIAVASFLGKFVFSIVTGLVGLAVFLFVGVTAATVILPATLFVGGILSVAAILGSLSVVKGGALSLAFVGFLATRSRKKKLESAPTPPRSEVEELERRRREENAELEFLRKQREELLDFDRRLEDRERGR